VEERGGSAYLLTVSDGGAPHAVHTVLRWEDDALVVDVGKRSTANAAARPTVSLLFPARTDGDYSLIVDGTAVVVPRDGEDSVRITPTHAILHRQAAVPDPTSSCSADCVPVLPAPAAQRR
jgi:hypothetical protein